MAEIPVKRKFHNSFKPVAILMVATILLLKSQRSIAEENTTVSTPTLDALLCPDFCNLAPDRATRGKAPFRMWYFEMSEGLCKRFSWAGRGGNKNRFRKKNECEDTCSKCTNEVPNGEYPQDPNEEESIKELICSLPMDEGRCTSESSSDKPQLAWYFQASQDQCSPFLFYGCEGNSNKFISRTECQEICI